MRSSPRSRPSSTTTAGTYYYYVVATGVCNSVASNAVTVQVNNCTAAVADALGTVTAGSNTLSVFINDKSSNGTTPTSANTDVSLTSLGGLTGATMNADGTIAIPANAIINKPVGQLELQRGDIECITVKYKSQMHRLHVRNHITACDIKLKSGEVIILNAMYFPLKHIVYMLCFFDYPLTTLHGNWSWAFLPNIIAVIFPVLVNVVVTGMLVKHYFL